MKKKIDKVELLIWLIGAMVIIALIGLCIYSCIVGVEIKTDSTITSTNNAVNVAVRNIIF
jgi:hypothetical protein